MIIEMRVLSVSNQKGGVGKTTTAVNLGASLAVLGKKVLLIDLDPQANATSGLGINKADTGRYVYQVMIGANDLQSVIEETCVKGMYAVPGSYHLAGVELELVNQPLRERMLARALSLLETSFDFVIIDCPPSLGLLTINALTAANRVIIPVQCEYYALEGLGRLMKTLSVIKKRFNPRLELAGILLTMYDPRTRLSQDIAKEVKGYFNSKVFNTVIPRNVRLSEAPSYGMPICLYDISSKGAQGYLMLAKEIIRKGENG